MKERPILFSGPMVRALLAGTKTQTRRVVKPSAMLGGWETGHNARGDITSRWPLACGLKPARCPYGQPGDRLWVREAFAGSIAYERHGYPLKEWGNKLWYVADGEPRSGQWTRPRPSIHMPRCLSRITLEVTGVRVERLQDISEADAIAEGIGHGDVDAAVADYAALWEQINGPGSWDANPWVWVVSFNAQIIGGTSDES